MSADECLVCGCKPFVYVSTCVGCEARLYARINVPLCRAALQKIEREHSREKAEAVREQAIRQRDRYGRSR